MGIRVPPGKSPSVHTHLGQETRDPVHGGTRTETPVDDLPRRPFHLRRRSTGLYRSRKDHWDRPGGGESRGSRGVSEIHGYGRRVVGWTHGGGRWGFVQTRPTAPGTHSPWETLVDPSRHGSPTTGPSQTSAPEPRLKTSLRGGPFRAETKQGDLRLCQYNHFLDGGHEKVGLGGREFDRSSTRTGHVPKTWSCSTFTTYSNTQGRERNG